MEILNLEKWLAIEREILQGKTGGKSFIEFTTYRGVALWWFIRYRLYHSAESDQLVKAMLRYSFFTALFDFLYDLATSLLFKVFLWRYIFDSHKKKTRTVLISAQDIQWGILRDLNGQLKKGDVFFDYIITELRKRNYRIITVHPTGYSLRGLRTMVDRIRQVGTVHKAFNIYWSTEIWTKTHQARKFFKKVWKNSIENNNKIANLLKNHQLETELQYCFNHVFERVVKRIEMASNMIDKEKPDVILMINEYSPFGQALVAASKIKNVPSLAIQHGNLGLGYIYSKENIPKLADMQTPYAVIPDKTAVFGQYYADFLTKKSVYTPDNVVVTGQPRHDIFAIADKVYSRENFCMKANLKPTMKIILVITENVPLPKGELFLKGVLKALKQLPDVQIVVKPHPGERGDWYNSVIANENVAVRMLPKDAETFEALYSCDLLIAGYSATITEAIILGKPVVSFLPTENESFAPYFKDVTLRVHKAEELLSAINTALFDEKERSRLTKAGQRFVVEHEYRLDGEATERIVNLIEEIVKEKRSKT